MCVLCLLFVCVMFWADYIGIFVVNENPLPETVKLWIERNPGGTVCGTVDVCEQSEYSQIIYLKNSYLIYKSEKIPIENIKVYISENRKVPAGAVIVVSGILEEMQRSRNPGGFDAKAYYACEHIFYQMKSGKIKNISSGFSVYQEFLSAIKRKLSSIFEKYAGTEASVFRAMILGEKDTLEQEKKTLYQMGGIIHILAISGLHINMFGVSVYKALIKIGLGMKMAGFLSLFLMIQYGVMTGNGVSTLRAICMFVLSVGGNILGRTYDMPTALALAAVLVLMESPAYLYNSSFQLSFGAVIAIGIVMPIVREILQIKRKWMTALLSSVVVQMITLPIVLNTYGEISLAGIGLNLLVLPTVHIILLSGTLGCVTGLGLDWLINYVGIAGEVWMTGVKFMFIPGRMILRLYETLCEWVSGFPWLIWIVGAPGKRKIILFYLVIGEGLLACVLMKKYIEEYGRNGHKKILNDKRDFIEKILPFVPHMILCITLSFGVCLISSDDTSGLKVTCLDVGQGDSVVMRTETGNNFLIDSGSTSKKNTGQYDLIPFLKDEGISYLDGIFISHTDADHINGIEELLISIAGNMTAIQVGNIFLPDWEKKNEKYRKIELLAAAAGAEVIYVNAGDSIDMEMMEIQILHPKQGSEGKDTNDEGIVLQIKYDDFCGLFMGDVGESVEKNLIPYLENVDFLKVGHHGSKYSSCSEFLQKISPEVAVISCGKENSYGHPADETIKRLEQVGCQIEYTMKHGAITVLTDGSEMMVERFLTS